MRNVSIIFRTDVTARIS